MIVDPAARVPAPKDVVVFQSVTFNHQVVRFPQAELLDNFHRRFDADIFVIPREVQLDRHRYVGKVVLRWLRLKVQVSVRANFYAKLEHSMMRIRGLHTSLSDVSGGSVRREKFNSGSLY